MFVHTLDPVIFSIGPLSIRYYSLPYIIGFLLAHWWLKKLVEKKQIKNLTLKNLDTLLIYLMVGVIAGGRVFQFIFYRPMELLANPLEVLYIWQGGMAFHGGLIGAALAAYLFTKKYKVSFIELADILAIPAAFALFLGRIGNFINGELVGIVTDVPWCVNFNGETNAFGEPVCRHPSQIYHSLKNLAIFFVLLGVHNIKNRPKGLIFWTFVTMYGGIRFVISFWKADPTLFLGISMGQTLSILMFILGAVMIYRIKKSAALMKK